MTSVSHGSAAIPAIDGRGGARQDLKIDPVCSPADQRAFIGFPWHLYRDDPLWVPPLIGAQRQMLGYRSHPFYEVAECQTFLARRAGDVVGRVAAIINHEHNLVHRERRGFFGFFESVDDPAVAQALFAAARQWLAARGMHSLRGPVNPSMNYVCGTLVHGFDTPPTMTLAYNPPYYGRLFEQGGLVKSHDMFAYCGGLEQLPAMRERLKPYADRVQEWSQATVRPMNASRRSRDIDTFLQLYNRSFEPMWGFVPLTKHEIDDLVRTLRFLVSPELALIAEVDGRPAGCVLGLPDYNPRIRQINGRLYPFGFLRLLWNRRALRRICVLSITVLPEYQRFGLGLLLLRGLLPKALGMGIREAEFSWISESNTLARGGLEKVGLLPSKTYRIYDSVDPPTAAR